MCETPDFRDGEALFWHFNWSAVQLKNATQKSLLSSKSTVISKNTIPLEKKYFILSGFIFEEIK